MSAIGVDSPSALERGWGPVSDDKIDHSLLFPAGHFQALACCLLPGNCGPSHADFSTSDFSPPIAPTMAVPAPPSIAETLDTLSASLQAALTSFRAPEFPSVIPPENGISLLDVKNELLLSYLHNVVFLALIKLRSGPLDGTKKGGEVGSEVVRDLAKLRLLLEKGVKPLETKLKYQIDKVVAAAVDDEIAAAGAPLLAARGEDEESGDDEDGVEHDDYGDYARPRKTAALAVPVSALSNTELSFRPNPLALAKPSAPALPASGEDAQDGVYRPPRISATSMPELPTTTGRLDKEARNVERMGRKKSHMLDEFVADELSTAPMAQPSIGSTIVAGGRVMKSARERREETERRDYEESNFVRLPALSKKELRERKRKGGDEEGQFGGEDWRSFAGDLDRLTKSTEKSGGKSGRLLEKSRKRRGDDEVGGGGGGRGLGENFERRRSKLDNRAKKRKV